MKKLFTLTLVLTLGLFSCGSKESKNESSAETQKQTEARASSKSSYIDLGLPSGTLWKSTNEKGMYYTYDEAVSQFGDQLPTREQFAELQAYCTWTWNGKEYVVKGDNGNSIVLRAVGRRTCDGDVSYIGTLGNYWSSTLNGSDYACYLYFDWSDVAISTYNRYYGFSVRLVQNVE